MTASAHTSAAMKRAHSRSSVKEWVDSNIFDADLIPEKSYEKTRVLHRDPEELLKGVTVTELDINLDTLPMELMELIHR